MWDVSTTIGSMRDRDAGFPDGGRVCTPEGQHLAPQGIPGFSCAYPARQGAGVGVLKDGAR